MRFSGRSRGYESFPPPPHSATIWHTMPAEPIREYVVTEHAAFEMKRRGIDYYQVSSQKSLEANA